MRSNHNKTINSGVSDKVTNDIFETLRESKDLSDRVKAIRNVYFAIVVALLAFTGGGVFSASSESMVEVSKNATLLVFVSLFCLLLCEISIFLAKAQNLLYGKNTWARLRLNYVFFTLSVLSFASAYLYMLFGGVF